ncbi:glycoside hydrolase family 32 protein [Paenibacillus sp.]|uniref:glycoside hydrolase family 32 protein n=1 Tax=Paenibacillus TaxID=44249 RepID=UPI003566D14B
MTYTVEKANRFIRENKHQLRSDFRLHYHFMSEYGWMNDPNGFIHYNGTYHLFYQYYPYEAKWGPMHWGHAVSGDLIRWEHLPVALAPDEAYDQGGCFSGSAIEHEGRLYLMYTGHVETGPDKDRDYRQEQAIAVSEDGVTFVKWKDNPVIAAGAIPLGVSRQDFRDPKVFKRGDAYYAVLGSNDGAGHGLILLYRSADLVHWEYVNVIAKSDGTLGDNWECPDVFALGSKDVLMMSPQRVPAQGDDYCNLHSTTYMVGHLDTDDGRFHYDAYYPIDYGFDFYAPQTTIDAQGRRVMIAWMDMWESLMPTQQGHHWAGAMTVPREVLTDGDRLVFKPVDEIEAYRQAPYELSDVILKGERVLETQGDRYELKVVIEAKGASAFGIKLRTSGREETVLSYHAEERQFRFNRDRSGIGPKGERKTSIELEDGKLSLRIFVDVSSVEVFLGKGHKVMTGRIYPNEQARGIALFSEGECRVVSLTKWDIG